MTIRISAPSNARKGEVITLKAMIRHDMETGYRRDEYGREIPRDLLKQFECRYNGELVFAATLFPGMAANPFLSFHTVATESGELEFIWVDQAGEQQSKTVSIRVT